MCKIIPHLHHTTTKMTAQDILHHLDLMRKWDAEAIPPAEDTNAYVSDILATWAPAAEKMGMEDVQGELQELAIKLGYPEDYSYLKKLLLESEMACEMVFRTFSVPIKAMLDDLGIEYDFKYRMKSVYSIWRKMRIDNKEFDDVYDLFATRIIYKPQSPALFKENSEALKDEPEVQSAQADTLARMDAERFTCWRIYTVIASLYRIQTDRIKNWISHPKPSGYQALQMTVMGPDCNWIEIQIRSERMHYEAEEGIAAHWKYKQEKGTH